MSAIDYNLDYVREAFVKLEARAAASEAAIPDPTNFTMDQLAAAKRVYQRQTLTGGSQSKGTGTIPVSVNVTTVGVPYFRTRSSDGSTILQPWTALPAFTATGAQTLNVTGVDARLGWFYVDLSADGTTPKSGTVLVGMGRVVAISGQSQAVRQIGKTPTYTGTNASLGVTIDPNCSVYARYTDGSFTVTTPVWAVPADGTAYNSTFVSEFLRRQVADRGVNCALVGHAVGATAIATWQPGQQNNTDLRAALNAVGGFEAFYWHQGGDDAGAGTSAATYQTGLAGVFGDLSARNAARGSSFERYVTAMGTRLAGGAGTTSTVQTIRKAAADWAASNGAVYLEPHDIVLDDVVHQNQAGNITLARHWHRASTMATDNGPILMAGTRTGTTIKLAASAPVTIVGSPTDRFSVFASGTSTSALAIASLSVSGAIITVNLSVDPGGAQALDVYWLRHPDPSGTTAAANMIYDTFTADGIPNGRQLQPTLAGAVTIAGGTATPTPTPTPTPSFYDTFTDADNVAMTAHTSNSGHTYTAITGTAVILGNEAASNFASGSAHYASFVPSSANYTVKANMKYVSAVANMGAWVLGRASAVGSTRTHYQAGYLLAGFSPYNAEGIYLGKTVDGTFTAIGYYAYTMASSAAPEVALVMNGTSLSVMLDGVTVIPAVTDTSITAAGSVGHRFTSVGTASTGVHIDNLTVV